MRAWKAKVLKIMAISENIMRGIEGACNKA
jgi:hypothetical protein